MRALPSGLPTGLNWQTKTWSGADGDDEQQVWRQSRQSGMWMGGLSQRASRPAAQMAIESLPGCATARPSLAQPALSAHKRGQVAGGPAAFKKKAACRLHAA